MSADTERAEAFERGYVNGFNARRSRSEARDDDSWMAGLIVGQAAAELDMCSEPEALNAGRCLGVTHGDRWLPDGLRSSDEATVYLAIGLGHKPDRSALHTAVRQSKPSLTIGRIDAIRRDLQSRGFVAAIRDGRQTRYDVAVAS